ncbi:MAG: mechanosensitive ion channel family protein [bacterium]|nr:mechanosensitive ion channel family protein [bacterium]
MNEFSTFVQEFWQYAWARALTYFLASFVAGKVVDFILSRAVARLARKTKTDLDNKLVALLHRPVFVTFVLIGLRLAAIELSLPATPAYVTHGLLATLIVVIWTTAGFKIGGTIVAELYRVSGRVSWIDGRTVPLLDNVVKLLLIAGAVYGVLLAWNLNATPWLASAGIAGIALGFAAKDTLANLFGGLSVIADAPYKVGDFINLVDTAQRGQVVQIGLRSSRLLTRDDVEVTVPNALIANSTVINESGGPWEKTRIWIEVGVAYGSDVDHVREVLTAAANSVEYVLEDPAPRIRFRSMGDSALIWRLQCWIDEPVLRGRTVDALNTAVYKALGAADISIPFPQRDVHIVSSAPPAAG